jgi:hypothetical protein
MSFLCRLVLGNFIHMLYTVNIYSQFDTAICEYVGILKVKWRCAQYPFLLLCSHFKMLLTFLESLMNVLS